MKRGTATKKTLVEETAADEGEETESVAHSSHADTHSKPASQEGSQEELASDSTHMEDSQSTTTPAAKKPRRESHLHLTVKEEEELFDWIKDHYQLYDKSKQL